MSISDRFISRPIATSLLMIGIVGAGAVVYPLLPVSSLPDVEFPTISVSAGLPGASPETVASAIATPLETQLASVPGVTQMTSTSSLGSASITLQFDLSVDINTAASDVQTAINAAAGYLPKTLPVPPTYRKVNPTEAPIMILAVQSNKYPLITVDDYAETVLAQHISQITGVGQVTVGGQQKPAVRIQIDPAKLANMNLGLEDVRAVLETATVDEPKGTLEGPNQAYTIYDNDQLLSAEPWNDVVVAYSTQNGTPVGYASTSGTQLVTSTTPIPNGSPVRVRDIGRAVDGPANSYLASWQNNSPGVLLIISKQPSANVVSVVQAIDQALPQLRASIPAGININVIMDRTQTIRASLNDIQLTLLLIIVVVVAVIFLFLRTLWTTVIAGIAIPISILGTFALMYVAGFSLDNLSLMGIAIAVGFVVDDAIVMLENCYRHIELGQEPEAAARLGAGEIGFTIISMSLSLVAVFIPILLMGGIVGRLFREFAIVITLAIAMSAFTSLTLSPMMCSLFLKRKEDENHGRFYYWMERRYQWAVGHYDRSLTWALRNRFLMLILMLVTIAVTIFLYIEIPKGFFPEQDTGFMQGTAQAAQDISFRAMVKLQRQVGDIIGRDPAVASFADFLGGSSTNTGRFFISLKPFSERPSVEEVIARIKQKTQNIAGIQLFLLAQQDVNVGGRLAATQYQYTLQDQNLEELDTWAPRILAKFQSMPQLTDVASDQQTSAKALTLTIDRTTAARFGIQPGLIDDTLYDAVGQRPVNTYYTQAGQYYVVMEINPALRGDPAMLDKLYIKSPVNGGPVPLSTFARYDVSKSADLAINHQGQFPSVTLSFNLPSSVSLGDAVTAIDNTISGMGLPAGLSGSFQGTAQAFEQSLSTEPYLVLAAIIVIYIILGMLYESYIHPLTILSTLPSAGLGALLFLLLLRYDLTIIALIGIILLIGIVKKNGIMMVDFALEAERSQNLTPEEAVHQAALIRFRPIMMTTFAALLGAIPLAIGFGVGAELRRPLGITIVGGLLISQALTLFTTPVVYVYMDDASRGLNRFRQRVAERMRRRPTAANR